MDRVNYQLISLQHSSCRVIFSQLKFFTLPIQGQRALEISVRKLRSVMKNLDQRAVPVLKGHVRAQNTIISEMNYAGRREVSMFNLSIKIIII
jgi:hypothetical protein